MYVIYSKFSIIIIITNFFSFLFQKFMNLILSSMCRFRCVLQWNFSSSTSLPWTFLNGNNEKKKSRERQSYKKLFDNIYILYKYIYILLVFLIRCVLCLSWIFIFSLFWCFVRMPKKSFFCCYSLFFSFLFLLLYVCCIYIIKINRVMWKWASLWNRRRAQQKDNINGRRSATQRVYW